MARTLLASLFAIGLTAVAIPSPAYADCAPGYNSVSVCVSISDITQIGGRDVSIRAQATTSTGKAFDCPTWTLTFSGESAEHVNAPGTSTVSGGSTFNRTFSTDEVDDDEEGHATLSCTYDNATLPVALGGVGHLSTGLATALTSASATGQVNLLEEGDGDGDDDDSGDDDDDGGLPDTGGERLLWLVIGLALVVGGTTVIVTSRNRDASA